MRRLRELVRAVVGLPRAAREVRTVGGGAGEVARVADGWSSRRARGGEIPLRCVTGTAYVVSPGHGVVSRAVYDAAGPDMLRRLLGGPRDRLTVVEPDGSLTEVGDTPTSG